MRPGLGFGLQLHMSGSGEVLSVVLDAVYACAADPDRWEDLIDVYASLEPLFSDGEGGLSDGGEIAKTLLPHLDRAGDVARRVLRASAAPDHNAQAQTAPPPVVYVLIGRDQRIISTSPSVPALLSSFCAPLDQGRLFSMEDPDNQKRYRDARDALKTGDGTMPVLFNFDDGTATQSVSGFLVDAPHASRLLGLDNSEPLHADSHALILPDRTALVRHDHLLRASLGLTPAELRLANLLKDGMSLSEAAPQLGIAVNTARNQLRAIFTKLGVNRQSEMVRHLAELGQLAAFVRGPDNLSDILPEPQIGKDGSGIETIRRFITLPDGRKLAYREYGAEAGMPVFFLHAVLSGSLLRDNEAQMALRHGLRLIVIERPGTGWSTPDPDMSFETVAADLEFLADALELKQVLVSGRSSGARFAIAVAKRLGARVPRLLLWAPRFNVDPESNRRDLLGRFYAGMRRVPWYARAALALLRAKLSRPFLREMLMRSHERSPADYALMDSEPGLLDFMVRQSFEALEITHEGVVGEARLLDTDQPLDLDGLEAELVIWHGREDGYVDGQEVERRVSNFPYAEFRFLDNEGHIFSLDAREKVFERLIA
tara:strand:+ start:334810 stop:336606 length:1797 start_codon:yes stop_codon:yes gene_type:complete